MSEVTITLDGDDVDLRCTPLAMKALCNRHGSLIAVQQKIASFDFNAMADVVEIGIGPKQLKHLGISREKLESAVYEAGMAKILAPLTRYIMMLANGGREPSDDGADEASDEGNG